MPAPLPVSATVFAFLSNTALTAPGADRVLFWDHSALAFVWLTMGTNLSISGTTLNAAGGGGGGVDESANFTWTGIHDYSGATVILGTLTVTTVSTSKLAFSATLATDLTYNGTDIRGINAGATITALQAVYYDFTAGEWLLADANGSSTYPAQGLAAAAGTDGGALTVITSGFVRNDAWNWSAGPIYLSSTAGGLTQTAPATAGDKVQPVGWAKSADIAYFHFNPFYGTVGA